MGRAVVSATVLETPINVHFFELNIERCKRVGFNLQANFPNRQATVVNINVRVSSAPIDRRFQLDILYSGDTAANYCLKGRKFYRLADFQVRIEILAFPSGVRMLPTVHSPDGVMTCWRLQKTYTVQYMYIL